MKDKKGVLTIAGIVAAAVALALLSLFGIGEKKIFSVKNINQGLDLKGGVSIMYEAGTSNPTAAEMQAATTMIWERLNRKNYTEAIAYQEGTDRIRVEIPGVSDAETAVNDIGRTALLQFTDMNGNVLLDGSNIADAKKMVMPSKSGGVGEIVVSLDFTSAGQELFSEVTGRNVGKIIHVTLDGESISSVYVEERITNGNAYISGGGDGFTAEKAEELAALIKSGALPFDLIVIDMSLVGARLGAHSLETGLLAGVIGAVFVLIFMVAFYGFIGLAADLALIIYIGLTLNALSIFSVTLTLPGIAGIILSIGMAVDANVIIFERIKEEIDSAKTMRSSVKAGFSRAFPAIFDGNVTTLIAAAVLFFMGAGTIRGFAQTLSMGILISMFTSIFITRLVLNAFISLGFENPGKLTGSKLLPRFKNLEILKNSRKYFILSSVVICVGLLFMIVNGIRGRGSFNLDVEFTGGISIQIDIGRDFQNSEISDVVKEFADMGSPHIQRIVGTNEAIIKLKSINQETTEILNALKDRFELTDRAILKVSNVSATISGEMRESSIIAVVVACAAMLLYVSIRFRDVKKGGSAILTLIHDICVIVAFYAVLRIPLNYSFIAVILTILGYSINATIIIFDRIRENENLKRKSVINNLIDTSVNQTLRRSLYTSFTTLITVSCLYIFGEDSIRAFALPVMFGLICGTYSSIFLSGSIWRFLGGIKKNDSKAVS